MDQALQLVNELAPSRSTAWVLSQASRYAMLAGRTDDAIAYGRRALELAAEHDLPEVRVHALNNVGVARVNAGDHGGVAIKYHDKAL